MYECIQDFAERMKTLAMFTPFYRLESVRKYPRYHLVSLGMGVLLYVLDHMLMGKSRYCDHQDIAVFLQRLVKMNYQEDLNEDQSRQLAYDIMDALRNDGRPFEYVYQNLQTGQSDVVRFHLIEIADYQIRGRVSFKLSGDGLDFLFKTREIYRELRVTVAQIYLRQQIERGVFEGALKAVDDLHLDVQQVYGELQEMRRCILRDVQTVSIERYKRMVQRVQQQFSQEKKVFAELKELLRQTEQELRAKYITPKEQKALDQLMEVGRRLDLVINQHNHLFTEKLDLGTVLEETLETHIAQAFCTRINIDRELVDGVISNRTPLNNLACMLTPLFKPRLSQYFNMQKAFSPRLLTRVSGDVAEQDEIDYSPELAQEILRQERALKEMRDRRISNYIETCLAPLSRQPVYTLGDLLAGLEESKSGDLINQADFYPFLVQLHQLGRFYLAVSQEMLDMVIDTAEGTNIMFLLLKYLKEHPELASRGSLEVLGSAGQLALENGFLVTNFVFYSRVEED